MSGTALSARNVFGSLAMRWITSLVGTSVGS